MGHVTKNFQRLAHNQELAKSSVLFDTFLDSLPAISSGELRLVPLKEVPAPFNLEDGNKHE